MLCMLKHVETLGPVTLSFTAEIPEHVEKTPQTRHNIRPLQDVDAGAFLVTSAVFSSYYTTGWWFEPHPNLKNMS